MVNYQLGKIYKIVCNTTGLVYIGSTCVITLARRLSGHRGSYKRFQNGLATNITSFQILENDNYEIILLENFPCNSKDELHARERHWIENNETVNRYIPIQTNEELKDYRIEYYSRNKDKLNEQNKTNHLLHKEAYNKKQKEYYTKNKEAKKIYNKQYREAKKALIQSETIQI